MQPNAIRSRISHHKARGIGPDEIAPAQKGSESKVLEHREFIQVFREYQSHLAASNLLDYDDLLVRCAELLRRHPACVSNVQAVLVDEFQDTNHIQYELMNLLASAQRRITVVGDPDQSIYGFRSAEIRNLTRMQRRYPDTAVVLLEDNYRSSGAILRSAQDVIEQDTSRPAKPLMPTHSVGTMPVLRKLPTADAEAQWIVLEIRRCVAMSGRMLNYADFAILLRSAALSQKIESEMGRQGVPYRMVGGLRFFDRVEIKLLLDYLRVVSQPGNTDALLRVINVPSRKIGDETIRLLVAGAEKAKKSLWEFVKDVAQGRRSTEKPLSKPATNGLCTFVGLVESARQRLAEWNDRSAPRKLLDFVMKKISFREYLAATHGANEENRWANVEELLGQADDSAAAAQDDSEADDSLPEIEGVAQQKAHAGEEALSRFLANVALSTEVLPQEGAEGEDGNQSHEKVTISTIHAAKGLEWPVVFVPAVYNGIIPHSRAEDSDEERRLLYVAMTRAQALLYLSYPLEQARTGEETSLTSFLPEHIVHSRFRVVGPSLLERHVYGIADILRRPRPSADAISAGQVSLPTTQDDQWTADGHAVPDAAIRWDGSRGPGGEPYPKRARQGGPPTTTMMTGTTMCSSAYTMSGSSTFSAPQTTMSMGFSTARQYIASAPDPTPDTTTTATTNDSIKNKPNAKPGLSQGSIAQFFGQRPSKPSQSGISHAPPTTSQTPSTTQPPQLSTTRITATNNNPIPPTLSIHHRTQASRLHRPALEPSDPNRYTWLTPPTNPSAPKPPTRDSGRNTTNLTNNPTNSATPRNTTSGESPPSATAKTAPTPGAGETGAGMRPVATYHTTTMSTAPRRTLGIRRSMNGWADRMKRG